MSGTIYIYAPGWILAYTVLAVVPGLPCVTPEGDSQQAFRSRNQNQETKQESIQADCKSTPKAVHVEEIQQKDQVKNFP